MYSPQVSVIIPTYKRVNELVLAINSVINQTYKNIEIIVVDDNGDNDYSLKVRDIVESYCNNNIKLITYKGNKNGAFARNQGILNANGEFISFLDDDDIYLETKIEKQVNYLINNKSKFSGVYCKMQNNKSKNFTYVEGDLSLQILKNISLLPTPTLLLFKNAILDIECFDENLLRHQDYDLMLRYFEKYKIGFVDEFLVIQGPNDGSNMLVSSKLEEMKSYFLNKFKKYIDKQDYQDRRDIYFANYYSIFIASLKDLNFRLITKYSIKCFIISPFNFLGKSFKKIISIIKKKTN